MFAKSGPAAESKKVWLISREIIFQEFQPMRSFAWEK